MKIDIKKYWKIIITALACIGVILLLFYGSVMGRIALSTVRDNRAQSNQITRNIEEVTQFYENRSLILGKARLDIVRKLSTLLNEKESGYDEKLLSEYYRDAEIEDNIILDSRRNVKSVYGCADLDLSKAHFQDSYYDTVFADADAKGADEVIAAVLKDSGKKALFTKVRDGYWVSVLPEDEAIDKEDIRYFWETALENLWAGDHSCVGVVDAATGEMIYCWDNTLEGKQLETGRNRSWAVIDGSQYYVTRYPVTDMGAAVVALTPVSEVVDAIMDQLFSVAVLIFTAVTVMVALIIFLRDGEVDADEEIHFLGKNFLKIQLKKYAAVGLLVSAILAAALMLVSELDYMTKVEASADLQIEKTVKLFDDYHEDTIVLENMVESKYYAYARMAETFLEHHPEYLTKEGLRYLANVFGVTDLAVFDSEGKTVSTSSPLDHLEILSDPESPLYDLRYVLMGKEEVRVSADARLLPEDISIFAVPIRLEDQIAEGIVAVETVTETIERFEPRGLLEDSSGVLQICVDKDGTILLFSDQKYVGKKVSSIGISEDMLYDGFGGRYTFNDQFYAAEVSSCKAGYTLLIFRYNAFSSEIIGNALLSTVMFIIAALYFAYDGLGSKFQFTSRPAVQHGETEGGSVLTVGGKMRKVIDICIYSFSAYFIIGQWMIHSGIGHHETINYIFNGDWERSVNVFSIVCNIYTVMIYYSIIKWVEAILMRAAALSGPSGETISHLIANLIKYLGAIICLYQITMNFGVDAKTALASVGIVGFGLTFGAQGLISDLISGIFILFEGSYKVGDTLLIGGEPYVVRSIGIRSTRVEADGKVSLINNSNMSGVVNITSSVKK